jgi:Tfp pilus assembly protein PilF
MKHVEDSESTTATARRRRDPRAALLLVAALIGLLGALGCAGTRSAEMEEKRQLAAATRDVGMDHLSNGRTAMAIRKIRQAVELNPDDPISYLALGEAYRRKGMLNEAEAEMLHALELSPNTSDFNYHETVLNLSALYIQMKRFDEALTWCQVLVDDPTFSTPWRALTNRGWAEYKLGRLDLARTSFRDAIEFHPRYAPAHLNLGIVEQEQRHWLPAVREFELALEDEHLAPGALAEANYRIAEVYVALGRRGKAIEHFSMAAEQAPYGEWGKQSRSYLELLR